MDGKNNRLITTNRKAYHDYAIEESFEAGLALTGTEIKSVRLGQVNLKHAYARPENGELWMVNAHIAPYAAGNRYNHDPKRSRKLLLHKSEIRLLAGAAERKGLTLVPLRLYLKGGRAKVELGLARGKKQYDKRKTLIKREADREMEKALKSARK